MKIIDFNTDKVETKIQGTKETQKSFYVHVDGQAIEVVRYYRQQGYHLRNLSMWNEAVSAALAELEGIELKASHWVIINFLREYYEEYQTHPSARVLNKALKRAGLNLTFWHYFPKGRNQANGIAGLLHFGCGL